MPSADAAERRIELSVLEDKIRGGWAGQMVGVTYGTPTELQYLERLVPEEDIPPWTPERVHGALHQDDLYVDVTLAQVLDEHGLDATTEDFAATFPRPATRCGTPIRVRGRAEDKERWELEILPSEHEADGPMG